MSSMPEAGRVITGIAKGTRLLAPGSGTRPLSDRVKQALFAAAESELRASWPVDVLDLFAGSGAAGIEGLSRGASRAVFVERDAGAAAVIGENLRRARLSGGLVVRRDALRYLSDAAASPAIAGPPFGLVVVDPPYAATADLVGALERLGDPDAGWLSADAVVVAKHFWRDVPPPRPGCLEVLREKRFGETMLTFYARATALTLTSPPVPDRQEMSTP
jgi:16S rRNA (guanine966-N2)-methyltransferase